MALLEIRDLCVDYKSHHRGLLSERVRAADSVSLTLERGSMLGVVGESGSGKSTVARAIVGLVAPTSGEILLDGRPLGRRRELKTRRRLQMVFQDPSTALNPTMTVGAVLEELLKCGNVRAEDRQCRAAELMRQVELPSRLLNSRPAELSGGQRQRVGIARALATSPDILVADEVTSALDVSVQASVLRLLESLRSTLGVSIVFISHDLAVVSQICDDVAVMRRGSVVEYRSAADVFGAPQHPYTQELLTAARKLHVEAAHSSSPSKANQK